MNEHSDPNSYSWCLLRYAIVKLIRNSIVSFLPQIGIELPGECAPGDPGAYGRTLGIQSWGWGWSLGFQGGWSGCILDPGLGAIQARGEVSRSAVAVNFGMVSQIQGQEQTLLTQIECDSGLDQSTSLLAFPVCSDQSRRFSLRAPGLLAAAAVGAEDAREVGGAATRQARAVLGTPRRVHPRMLP